MSGNSSFFKLGIFVLAGLALFVGGVVFFGASEMFTPYVTIETATPQTVEGLDVGAAVKFSGVTVGKVSKIEMAMWNHHSSDPAVAADIRRYVYMEMSIRRDLLPAKTTEEMVSNLDSAVQQGLRVRMASSGLTGPAFLEISFMDPKQYPVAVLPWKPQEPCIPSAPAAMTQIVNDVEGIVTELHNARLGETLVDARNFLQTTNSAIEDLKTKELRQKAVALLDETDASVHRVHEILDDPKVKEAIADLPKVTTPLRETIDRIDTLVHDPKIQKIIDDLGQASAAAGPDAEELHRMLRTVNQVLDSRRRDLEATITDLRRLLSNGDAMMEDAKNNPSRLIFGQPPPHIDETIKK